MTATAADASRPRPVEPFYAAVLASPARIEDSTRAGPGVLTGLALSKAIWADYDKGLAEQVSIVNAAYARMAAQRPEDGEEPVTPPVEGTSRRRKPGLAFA